MTRDSNYEIFTFRSNSDYGVCFTHTRNIAGFAGAGDMNLILGEKAFKLRDY